MSFGSIWQYHSSDFIEHKEDVRTADEERFILRQLKWLHVNRPDRPSKNALESALIRGCVNMADCLYASHPARYFDDPLSVYKGRTQIEWVASKYEWVDQDIRDMWINK